MNTNLRRSKSLALITASALALSFNTAQPILANCNDRVGSREYYKPARQRHWAQLQAQTSYPWRTAKVYDALAEDKIRLSSAFGKLSRQQKRQVIEWIGFEYGEETLRQLLTPTEQQKKIQGDVVPPGGAMSPYKVVTQEGRLVYTAFDGCTPMILLSERERYSYYTLRPPTIQLPNGDREPVNEKALRNAYHLETTSQCSVNFSPSHPKRTRILSWKAYDNFPWRMKVALYKFKLPKRLKEQMSSPPLSPLK